MADHRMQGFFGIFSVSGEVEPTENVVDVSRSQGGSRSRRWCGSHGIVDAIGSADARISHSSGEWRCWFEGDLPGLSSIPWERIIDAASSHDHSFLTTLNGSFAILLVHEASGAIRAISDRRAQQPLFSYVLEDKLYLSTKASVYCRLPAPPAFDPLWLYETIYFNHSVLDRSFLQGVSRVPPATVMSWSPGERGFSYRSWAAPFSRSNNLLHGKDAAALELTRFIEVANDLFDDDSHTAVALTAGFDSRAVLAAAPRRSDLLAYTYGRAGCADISDAAAVAAELGIRHLPIELSDQFVESLPELMVRAVRDSDGLERVLRAELLAAYPAISRSGRTISIGGVSGDHVFRDHINGTGNVPHMISASMMGYIHGHGDSLSDKDFVELFAGGHNEFRDHIDACLDELNQRHGDIRYPEGYQRYLVYENAPKHFGGEAALASNYVKFRSLYWDPRIIDLSFSTERATLGLSERQPEKDSFLESAAQAGVIAAGKHFGGGRIHGIRASTWASSSRARYRLEKMLVKGPRFVLNGFRRSRHPSLLSWPAWLAGPASPLCRELLGPDARLRKYLDERFLATFEPTADLRLASRLMTAELVMRLIEQRWPSDFALDIGSR